MSIAVTTQRSEKIPPNIASCDLAFFQSVT